MHYLKELCARLLSEEFPLSSTQHLIGYLEEKKHEPALQGSSTFVITSIQAILSRQNAVEVTKAAFVHGMSFWGVACEQSCGLCQLFCNYLPTEKYRKSTMICVCVQLS